MYEKQCKRLKTLDERGAESGKVEAAQFSIRKLLTQINVSVRAVDTISSRIHKLRDEELRPQLQELIYGYEIIYSSTRPFEAVLANCFYLSLFYCKLCNEFSVITRAILSLIPTIVNFSSSDS